MNLKVQIVGKISTAAHLNPRSKLCGNNPGVLTFHAQSDGMKARVLETIAAGFEVHVSPTIEEFTTGEWYE